jgi:uncharacterized protein (DUF927 family)
LIAANNDNTARAALPTQVQKRGRSMADTTTPTAAAPDALAHALAYARMGWPVFPLKPGSKVPATGHGFKDATTDPTTIRRAFKALPRAGVGIHPGPARLLVLDVDQKPGKPSGVATLARLEAEHGTLPATLRQRTPTGGGFHLLFEVPEGFTLGNSVPAGWDGLDVRCSAGYIAAAPTQVGGRAYAFDGWDATTGEAPRIAPAPAWLLALLTAPATSASLATTTATAAPAPSPAPATDPDDWDLQADTVHELRDALAHLVQHGKADPDDYGAWVRIGQRLKTAGAEGRALWLEFGARSAKFDAEQAAAKWDTFKPDRTGYAAIFKEAQAAGWVNPRSKAGQLAQATEQQRIGGGTFALLEHVKPGSATAPGVYFTGTDKDGNEKAPLWVCTPLRILAKTRGAKAADWGRLLTWRDSDGNPHRWAVPSELLAGDGLDVRRELMRTGLEISPARAARELLGVYLQSWQVEARARCVERLGWLGSVYVLPDEAIGADGESVVFQSTSAMEPAYAQSGTVESWRDNVAVLARGNSRMVFAICCAFAPPLADPIGEDSGGFHLRGKSSSGKSTALALAASVWGSPASYPRLWRTTANGLEGLAAIHNDGLLILDELSQVDPREAGDAAYLLANGQGKTRASRAGMARAAARWRLLFLSAGEESLAAMMGRAGKRTNAGQEVRLADIEADAGAGLGAFEVLNGQPTPAALALALKDAAARHHGAVGVAWLRYLVGHRTALATEAGARVRTFVAKHAAADASGQVLRVARRFGLVATAGELATRQGLTGWQEGEAFSAAARCFAAWLDGYGGGNREDRALLSQVRAFFEVHGASRFQPIAMPGTELDGWDSADPRISNRAGFVRSEGDGVRQFLVLPEVFKRELCAGFDPKAAAAALVAAGWIAPSGDGKAARNARLPGISATARVYAFTGKVWDADADAYTYDLV